MLPFAHGVIAERLGEDSVFSYNRETYPCEGLIARSAALSPRLVSDKGGSMSDEVIVVKGNGVLEGTVRVSGAKNSALKLMAASILGQGKTVLHNVPDISDIHLMGEVLRRLGATVERQGHTVTVDTSTVDSFTTPYDLVSKMRASISVLGPLIGRFGRAHVAMPGGCQIGARKIDMHMVGLEALGVQFTVDNGDLLAETPNGIHGASVVLEFASVGATENMLMAAVVAPGHTVIENAAREPEIVDLANMLNAMGAKVTGAGSPVIEVEGVPLSEMHPCEHTTVGDRIEAGTFFGGRRPYRRSPYGGRGQPGPSAAHMAIVKLRAMGCDVTTGENSVHRFPHPPA